MRFLILFALALSASLAHAQRYGESLWLDVDYTYSEFSYKEPNANIKGHMPGIRGDLGLALFDSFGLTVGGEYRDGNLNYEGATYTAAAVKTLTSDYMRDTYAMANLMFGPITISAGVAQREWLNSISGAYRRRLSADYYPASITLYRSSLYIKAETLMMKSGHAKIYMHDAASSESDVDLTQNSGSGYGAELGFMFPNMLHIFDRIFVAYRRWDVSASEAQSDGVRTVQADKYTLEIWQAGLGLNF